MKDKITLSYILLSVLIIGGITFFVAKIDISQMNSDISQGGSEVLSVGEEYSKKLYNLAVAKMATEDNITDNTDGKQLVIRKKGTPPTTKINTLSITSKQVNPIKLKNVKTQRNMSSKTGQLAQVTKTNSATSKTIFSHKKGGNK